MTAKRRLQKLECRLQKLWDESMYYADSGYPEWQVLADEKMRAFAKLEVEEKRLRAEVAREEREMVGR